MLRIRTFLLAFIVALVICGTNLIPSAVASDDCIFTTPTCVTAACHPAVQNDSDPYYLLDNYRMSRNPGDAMAFDTSGTLHLAYWSGYYLASGPGSPSAVYYRSWTEKRGWSDQQIVDDSYNGVDPAFLGVRMGGRHPNLAIDKNNTVWIVWHDHRDCGVPPPYNSLNNIEIYCDSKPAGEEWFSPEDIRLTHTTADQMGDNGYCPRIRVDPVTNKKTVMWYDFTVDGWFSDIFMMTSDPSGVFDTSTPILLRRITNADDRQPVPPQTLKPAFDMPDFVITPEGKRYVIWTDDFGGSVGNSGAEPIYFAEVPDHPQIVSHTTIVANNDGYWYPPKMKLAPNGDLWVLYTGVQGTAGRSVEAIRRRAGQTQFDAPVVLKQGGKNLNPDMAIDSQGRFHVVWIEDGGYQNHLVRYLLYDPATGNRLREVQLTSRSGAWATPCITLNKSQWPYIVYSEGDSDNTGDRGDIWFVRGTPPPNAAKDWNLYE